MFKTGLCLLLVFAVVFAVAQEKKEEEEVSTEETSDFASASTAMDEPEEEVDRCNCDDRCPEKVIEIESKKKRRSGHKERKRESALLEEDSDGDGDLTICAKNRDDVDRTFPSVCHMMCFNKCTRFKTRQIVEYDEIITYVSAFRDNFYKLHDGACPALPDSSSEKPSAQ